MYKYITRIHPLRTSELQERLAAAQERLRQAESDLEELQGEKSAKYRELKKREETMKGIMWTCTVHEYKRKNVPYVDTVCVMDTLSYYVCYLTRVFGYL